MNEPGKMLVTIDGPAGVGKSTAAALVADKLQIPFLNTGAMFRVAALRAGPQGLAMPHEELAAICQSCHFSLSGAGKNTVLLCNGKPVGEEIRSEGIALAASELAKRPEIRSWLLTVQRAMGKSHDLVAEGRDMGSVVFPDAPYKFFLDAAPHIRAERRFLELQAKGKYPDFASLEKEILARDRQDRDRVIAPLAPAQDAMIIDTSHLSIEEVADTILQAIKNK